MFGFEFGSSPAQRNVGTNASATATIRPNAVFKGSSMLCRSTGEKFFLAESRGFPHAIRLRKVTVCAALSSAWQADLVLFALADELGAGQRAIIVLVHFLEPFGRSRDIFALSREILRKRQLLFPG